jgi:propionyl-CoA carboxylase alpha chain
LLHNGTRFDAELSLGRPLRLHALMPHKAPPDMSHMRCRPCRVCWSEAARWGQKVQAGERIVIEAMKMENVLFASHC